MNCRGRLREWDTKYAESLCLANGARKRVYNRQPPRQEDTNTWCSTGRVRSASARGTLDCEGKTEIKKLIRAKGFRITAELGAPGVLLYSSGNTLGKHRESMCPTTVTSKDGYNTQAHQY